MLRARSVFICVFVLHEQHTVAVYENNEMLAQRSASNFCCGSAVQGGVAHDHRPAKLTPKPAAPM